MNEAVRNLAMLVWAVCAINSDASAKANAVFISEESHSPREVLVYGASTTPSGKRDEVLIEQPSANDNPLGNPIVAPANEDATASDATAAVPDTQLNPIQYNPKRIQEDLPQNPPVSSETPQEANKQIQNTLYESGDRIYDVQSYPADDIKKIEEPNINPTISTTPSY